VDRGTFRSLCEVIRDRNVLNPEEPLKYSEEILIKQILEASVLQCFLISGVSQSETIGEIDWCLEQRK
jgi:hypothetical protein